MKDSATAGVADDFTARRALAKSISAIESGGVEALAIEQRALEQPAAAHVLGITGPPGAGKSSLISALLPHALAQYGAVAVLAVDPSSSLTGGALLGALSTPVLVLMAVGGGLYTAGVGFYLWERLPFHNTIWHVFVLAASLVFYAAVLVAVLG